MGAARGILLFSLMFLAGCETKPVHVQDRNGGIAATFPGQPRTNTFSEPTPFGDMEWFSTEYTPYGRMDEGFFVQVGNLPRGKQGGTTPPEVLATFQTFLERSFGKLEITVLPTEKGPGFRYRARVPSGAFVEGIIVVRRGRIHRAQATTGRAEDPRAKAFLDSFTVA